jgi:hypothetical protein
VKEEEKDEKLKEIEQKELNEINELNKIFDPNTYEVEEQEEIINPEDIYNDEDDINNEAADNIEKNINLLEKKIKSNIKNRVKNFKEDTFKNLEIINNTPSLFKSKNDDVEHSIFIDDNMG